MSDTKQEKIILGIDPGTQVMGFGIIEVSSRQMHLRQMGVIHLKKYGDHELRLRKIFDLVVQLIDEYLPDEMAIESPFYGKNAQSMLKLGRAQGVAMAAALSRDLPIQEYAPRKIKQSVTGNGDASKEQVLEMVRRLLHMGAAPNLLDASDALAVAICHHFQGGKQTSEAKSWDQFISKNPGRVK